MDFMKPNIKKVKKDVIEITPGFQMKQSKDLMIRAKDFYAVWDPETELWSTSEFRLGDMVDAELWATTETTAQKNPDVMVSPKCMLDSESGTWGRWMTYKKNMPDNYVQLDTKLLFANSPRSKSDYASRHLPYSLVEGDIHAWDEIIGTLYSEEERRKIEWCIGAIISGEAQYIQKFLVFYGSGGTGKSTILNIVQRLFEGYYITFEAKALTSTNNTFSMDVFKTNPLVAIQHDGDLSHIEDNSKLNSIVSHEVMTINEKFKPTYSIQLNAFLMMGTNKPVRITDAKSGLIRRLIDVTPTGNRIEHKHYQALMAQIAFELGAIASHCKNVFETYGKAYYDAYKPLEMMVQTDSFVTFIEDHYLTFKKEEFITAKTAWRLYKEWCTDAGIAYPLNMVRFKTELKEYFEMYYDRKDGKYSVYTGFRPDKLNSKFLENADTSYSLVMEDTKSLLDGLYSDQPAQYASSAGTPKKKWDNVETKLSDLDTSKLHYVKMPENHIVIDFDLKDEKGEKSLEKNLEAASLWPPTYSEFSKSGAGIHLHYIYEGDTSRLSPIFEEGVEVKVFVGNSSLRRQLSYCNTRPVTTITGGLPLKEKRMMTTEQLKSEAGLRKLIERNLRKEIMPGTKPSMDFIHKILEDAYEQGLSYDVTDMRPQILAFANNSTNQALYCIRLMQTMTWKSEDKDEEVKPSKDERLVFFDLEVFPNLFTVCWKYEGADQVVKMINPTAAEVEPLLDMKLVGFNNRRYDNHILYAASLGYSNEELYKLSTKLVDNQPGATFGSAYGLSYADIYDFASKKQGLKKYQIELGLSHKELGMPWDEPVPDDMIMQVVEYNANDVITTEQVFNALKADFAARQLLSDLSGLPVNATTQNHTAKIIFGDAKNPQGEFVYTDLSKEFPGYQYDRGKSTYLGDEIGEGGYVYAVPGMYENVVTLDVASMHPTSIVELELFGPYTSTFQDLITARLAVKRRDRETLSTVLGGRLEPFTRDESQLDALAYALKIVINIVYGLTAARFDNPFRDSRNKDNIVAKRGALFMRSLRDYCEKHSIPVVHIKTDSIKVPGATSDQIDEIKAFGEEYGYVFEVEAVYDKFCLVNDAVYIARKDTGQWEAVGLEFQRPYVFKTLFSHEAPVFDDFCETKTVAKGEMWLDFDVPEMASEGPPMALEEPKGSRRYVGRAGRFTPVTERGGRLLRVSEGKEYAVTGTKGYFWMESEVVQDLMLTDKIDMSYFQKQANDAVAKINQFGDFDEFVK